MGFIRIEKTMVKMGTVMRELYELLADGKRHSMPEIRRKIWLNAIPESSVRANMNGLRKVLNTYDTGLIIVSDFMPTEEYVFAYRLVKSLETDSNVEKKG